MGSLANLPPTPLPPAAIVRVLARFGRAELSSFISVAIDLLDLAEPDADLEEDDPAEEDDPSGHCDEDGINTTLRRAYASGAGCAISDPDSEHDGREHEDYV
jgi:hypothetical protein